jgi:hypothetical protein
MKTYKTVSKKVEDQVICDVCGKVCTNDYYVSEYATVEALWGYSSSSDGQKFDIQLCENCFGDMLGWMTQKRKEYLGLFNYPYDKDPLRGEPYYTLRD